MNPVANRTSLIIHYAVLSIGIAAALAPSTAWSQLGWTRDEFRAAIEKQGGQYIDGTVGPAEPAEPLRSETFYFDAHQPAVGGGLARKVSDVAVSLRENQIVRAQWEFQSSNDTLEKVFSFIASIHALAPVGKESKAEFKDQPELQRVFPPVGSSVVFHVELQAPSGYERVSLSTGKSLGSIWVGTGRYVPEFSSSTRQVIVLASQDHQQYIAVRTLSHARKERGVRDKSWGSIRSVTFFDRETFWEYAYWDFEHAFSEHERNVKEVTPPNRYESLQNERRLQAILYQAEQSAGPPAAVAGQIDALTESFPNFKDEAKTYLAKRLSRLPLAPQQGRIAVLEAAYGVAAIDVLMPVVRGGGKRKEGAVAALERLATRLELDPAPGLKGNARQWSDWAAAAKKKGTP